MTPQDLLRDMHDRPDWQEDAVCAQADPEAWFPEQGGSTLAAKRICLACPVVAQCLAYALEHQERFGVWGGYSERERRRLAHGQTFAPSMTQAGNHESPLGQEQEFDLMDLLAQGWTHKRLAGHFEISVSAVRRIRDRRTKRGGAAA